MSKLGILLSGGTLVLSIIAHVATFVPRLPVAIAQTGLLHLTALASFGLMIFKIKSWHETIDEQIDRQANIGLLKSWKMTHAASRALLDRAMRTVSRRARACVVVAFVYAFVNIGTFMVLSGGVPEEKDGQYYLHNHGQKLRDLTEDEYVRQRAYVVRFFSSGWILFSIVPFVFFTSVRPPTSTELNHCIGGDHSDN